MLKRCDVLAEVDNSDISSSHKPSVIQRWGGGGVGALCKDAFGMEKWWVVLPMPLLHYCSAHTELVID